MSNRLLCKIGVHQWYSDHGLIRSALRCNLCGTAQNQESADALDAERARVGALPSGCTLDQMYLAALKD